MSDWTVHLAFEEGTSSKFWRARVEGRTLYVNYGKIGTNGQTQVKELADPSAAKAEYDKLVRDKRKKGYVEAGGTVARAADDDNESQNETKNEDRAGGDDDADDEDGAPPARKPVGKPAAARPAAASPASPASGVPGHRLMLDAGGRKAETTLYLDGKTVRMDSRETYASPEAARKAFERLKRLLGGEGYRDA